VIDDMVSVLPLGEQCGDGGHAHQEALPQEDQDSGGRPQRSIHRYLVHITFFQISGSQFAWKCIIKASRDPDPP